MSEFIDDAIRLWVDFINENKSADSLLTKNNNNSDATKVNSIK